jgi:hypothetical protein
MKKFGIISGQIILMMIGYIVISQISGMLSGSVKLFVLTKEQELAAAKSLVLVSFFFSSLMIYICRRSNWFGVKLFLAIFCLYFGITVFLTQIESYLFLDQLVRILPKGSLHILVLNNTISAVLFSFLSVLISGKWKKSAVNENVKIFEIQSVEMIIKVITLGIIYYFIYTLFGKFVMVPIAGHYAFTSYYGELRLPQWFLFFQIGRGMVWVLIALPILSMLKGNKLEKAIVIGLSFAILMGFNLLIPLPFMPEKIRIAHFVEVSTSNFIFGVIVVYVMYWKVLVRTKKEKTSTEKD